MHVCVCLLCMCACCACCACVSLRLSPGVCPAAHTTQAVSLVPLCLLRLCTDVPVCLCVVDWATLFALHRCHPSATCPCSFFGSKSCTRRPGSKPLHASLPLQVQGPQLPTPAWTRRWGRAGMERARPLWIWGLGRGRRASEPGPVPTWALGVLNLFVYIVLSSLACCVQCHSLRHAMRTLCVW